MFGDCENCPAKTWLCEYYNLRPGCEAALKTTGVSKEKLDDKKEDHWKFPNGFIDADTYLEYIKASKAAALGIPKGFLEKQQVPADLLGLLKYFLTVKREFCTCVVDAFCNKTDEKCDKCKEYEQMVEKAKKLLNERM